MQYFGGYGDTDVCVCTKEEYICMLSAGKSDDRYYLISDDGLKLVKNNVVVGIVNAQQQVLQTSVYEYIPQHMKRSAPKAVYEVIMSEKNNGVTKTLDDILYFAANSLTIGGLDLEKIINESAVS